MEGTSEGERMLQRAERRHRQVLERWRRNEAWARRNKALARQRKNRGHQTAMRRTRAALVWLPDEDAEMAVARDLELAPATAGTRGAVAAVADATTSAAPALMATVASTSAGPAPGLTKANAVEPPQVTFSAKDVDFSEWKGDVLVVAVTEKDLSKDSDSNFENVVLKKLDNQVGGLLAAAAMEVDFTGKAWQSMVLHLTGQGLKRVGLIGLGQNAPSTVAASRGLGESLASVAKAAQASSAAIVFANPSGMQEEFKLTAAASIASGTLLELYEDIRNNSESKKVHLKQVDIIGLGSGVMPDEDILAVHDVMEFHLGGRNWLDLVQPTELR